jgi:hypothetical protein
MHISSWNEVTFLQCLSQFHSYCISGYYWPQETYGSHSNDAYEHTKFFRIEQITGLYGTSTWRPAIAPWAKGPEQMLDLTSHLGPRVWCACNTTLTLEPSQRKCALHQQSDEINLTWSRVPRTMSAFARSWNLTLVDPSRLGNLSA